VAGVWVYLRVSSGTTKRVKTSNEKVSTDLIDELIDQTLTGVGPEATSLFASGSQTKPEPQETTSSEQGEGPPPAQQQHKGSKLDDEKHRYLSEDNHRLSVKSTRNNTHITFANPRGQIIFRTSGGKEGFKGANRASYECGYACATKVLERVKDEKETISLHIFLNGFGQGREALYRAIVANDTHDFKKLVVAITDNTPLKIGGTRPKKARRL